MIKYCFNLLSLSNSPLSNYSFSTNNFKFFLNVGSLIKTFIDYQSSKADWGPNISAAPYKQSKTVFGGDDNEAIS